VKAIFRRVNAIRAEMSSVKAVVKAGGITIDPERRSVVLDGRPLELTAKEFELLHYLAQNPGRVYTREQLLDFVWGYNHAGYEHTVNSHVNRLRGKIERDPANPVFVRTVWGVGYKFGEGLETAADRPSATLLLA
jgi:DNA-binding response OmpR family regulator